MGCRGNLDGFAGVSGCLEVGGLTLWGWHLGGLMLGGRPANSTDDAQPLLPDEAILARHRVGDMLDLYPHLLAVYLACGFKPLASSWMRNHMANRVTIAQACRFVGIDADAFLVRLNQERARAQTRISLPLTSCAST